MFSCSHCKKSYTTKAMLDSHINTVQKSNKTQYMCTTCGKLFLWKSVLHAHLIRHSNNKNYKCHVCCKAFHTKVEVKNHLKTHTDTSKDLQCSSCDKRFFTQGGRNQHFQTIHMSNCWKVTCIFCGKLFISNWHYFQHILRHIEEKGVNCELCDKPFYDRGSKNLHIRKDHLDEKSYLCKFCGKCFLLERDLKNHLVENHLLAENSLIQNQNLSSCLFCESIFKGNGKLFNHIRRVHINQPCLKCKICSREFYSKSEKNIHLAKHNGEMPHKCNICSKSFYSSSSLKRHGFTHLEDKPLKCVFCSDTFLSECHFWDHILREIDEIPSS